MFNSTFFKFLIAFVVIICASFLVMSIAGSFDPANNSAETVILK